MYCRTLTIEGIVLFRLYWHKLKTLNYITKLLMFSHNCVVTWNYVTAKNNFMLTGFEIFFSSFDEMFVHLKLQKIQAIAAIKAILHKKRRTLKPTIDSLVNRHIFEGIITRIYPAILVKKKV